MEMVLEAHAIYKTFEGTNGPIHVLSDLELEVRRGEIVVVIGASGAGKSTLLHVLGTLDRPDRGKVVIDGTDPFSSSEKEINRIRNKKLGFVFQFHYLLPEFSALENVMMPAVVGRGDEDGIEERAAELLRDVGLRDRLTHRPAELSGGEQQRVAVARALMNDPAIILADEPSGNLDDRNSEMLHETIKRLSREKGQTFVIVTHKKELLAKADTAYLLAGGRLQTIGDGEIALSDL
ncbi:MAG: lipoprotein ABC transporter ATP-binding protein [Candidatus Latescibacteria bacterium 4484_7]|nr:MAG: lipoprotein ABC transporter ATP-binding protein [Candidatus Latescibacteria bacterium 4484_7]